MTLKRHKSTVTKQQISANQSLNNGQFIPLATYIASLQQRTYNQIDRRQISLLALHT